LDVGLVAMIVSITVFLEFSSYDFILL